MIETTRLIMRKFEMTDAEEVLAFATDPEVNRYIVDPDAPTDIGGVESLIQNIWHADYKKYGYGRLALVEKESGRVIGFCGLKYLPELGKADLGYRMLPEFWGQGYATESGAAVIQYGYDVLGLPEIIGLVVPGNKASERVLHKLGFVESAESPIVTEAVTAKLLVHVR